MRLFGWWDCRGLGLGLSLLVIAGSRLFAQERSSDQVQDRNVDIAIIGAGTGGISAAIQAARLGAQVALLEETDWIGGQMTASADATMDEGNSPITQNSGLYAEFIERMHAYYIARNKPVGTCYGKDQNHCYEPFAIQKI